MFDRVLAGAKKNGFSSRREVMRFAAVALIFILGIWIGRIVSANGTVREIVVQYGYAGIFVVSVLSGFNIAIPVPAVAFLPAFLVSGLEFWPTIALMTVGVTIADMTAYFLGRTGRNLVPAKFKAAIRRLERIRERYHWAPLTILFFWSTLAPLPNELLIIPLGLMGYGFFAVMPIALAGNALFNLLSAIGIAAVLKYF